LSKWLVLALAAAALVGCGAKEETVDVPKSATEGGNVVNDPEMKKLTGESDMGTGGAGGGQSGQIGG